MKVGNFFTFLLTLGFAYSSIMDYVPIVGTIKSLVMKISGDPKADDTLRHSILFTAGGIFMQTPNDVKQLADNFVDLAHATPVVGHTIGGVHYIIGNKEVADEIMASAPFWTDWPGQFAVQPVFSAAGKTVTD